MLDISSVTYYIVITLRKIKVRMLFFMNKYLVISKISRIRSDIYGYIEDELKQRGIVGLVVSHGNILDILYNNNGKLSMKEICEGINRSKSTVTQLVDKLLKEGYVRKETDAEDKRFSYVVLTEKGRSIKKDFREISDNVVKEFFKDFTEEEAEALLNSLDRVISNFTR